MFHVSKFSCLIAAMSFWSDSPKRAQQYQHILCSLTHSIDIGNVTAHWLLARARFI